MKYAKPTAFFHVGRRAARSLKFGGVNPQSATGALGKHSFRTSIGRVRRMPSGSLIFDGVKSLSKKGA